MSLQDDLRRGVFGEEAVYRTREGRTKEGRVRQAYDNLNHILDGWLAGNNTFSRKLTLETYSLPEKEGGWHGEWKSEYIRLYEQLWRKFEKIRAEVISEDPGVMTGLEEKAGKEETDVLEGLSSFSGNHPSQDYDERLANLPITHSRRALAR